MKVVGGLAHIVVVILRQARSLRFRLATAALFPAAAVGAAPRAHTWQLTGGQVQVGEPSVAALFFSCARSLISQMITLTLPYMHINMHTLTHTLTLARAKMLK